MIADEGKRIKTPANDREGEELVIVEPAEDVMITQAPTEVPLSETGTLKFADIYHNLLKLTNLEERGCRMGCRMCYWSRHGAL